MPASPSFPEEMMDQFKLQTSDYDCGPTVLRAALGCFGISGVDADELASVAGTTPRRGTGVTGLKRVLDLYGVGWGAVVWGPSEGDEPRMAARSAWQFITTGTYPAIVSLDEDEHWGLVLGCPGGMVLLFDPAVGVSSVPKREFMRRWRCRAAQTFYCIYLFRHSI